MAGMVRRATGRMAAVSLLVHIWHEAHGWHGASIDRSHGCCVSSRAQVARVSAVSLGLVYGATTLSILKVRAAQVTMLNPASLLVSVIARHPA